MSAERLERGARPDHSGPGGPHSRGSKDPDLYGVDTCRSGLREGHSGPSGRAVRKCRRGFYGMGLTERTGTSVPTQEVFRVWDPSLGIGSWGAGESNVSGWALDNRRWSLGNRNPEGRANLGEDELSGGQCPSVVPR